MIDEIKRLEDIYAFLSRPEWGEIVKDIQELHDAINSVHGITDEKSLHFCRGRLLTLNEIIHLKDSIEEQLDNAKADNL